jgi:hypothetical protein
MLQPSPFECGREFEETYLAGQVTEDAYSRCVQAHLNVVAQSSTQRGPPRSPGQLRSGESFGEGGRCGTEEEAPLVSGVETGAVVEEAFL